MRYSYTYEIHKSVEGQRFRHREREHGHLRDLKRDERSASIVSRVMGGLLRLRSAEARGRRTVAYEAQVLTERVCRMADGSTGRIAIREADGQSIEVCIPA